MSTAARTLPTAIPALAPFDKPPASTAGGVAVTVVVRSGSVGKVFITIPKPGACPGGKVRVAEPTDVGVYVSEEGSVGGVTGADGEDDAAGIVGVVELMAPVTMVVPLDPFSGHYSTNMCNYGT